MGAFVAEEEAVVEEVMAAAGEVRAADQADLGILAPVVEAARPEEEEGP